MKFTQVQVVNFECNSGIGFSTASFLLQELGRTGTTEKISLKEIFLEYTNVSSSLKASLNSALFNYHEGNHYEVNKITKRYNLNSGYRSQPRQNSSRYTFKNDFSMLIEKQSE